MARYRWIGAAPFHDNRSGRTVDPGAVVELPERVGESQPELVRVEDDQSAASDAAADDQPGVDATDDDADTPEGASGTLPFNPDAHTVDELSDRVADIDDADVLRALRNIEADQRDRTTAIDAIEARLGDLAV